MNDHQVIANKLCYKKRDDPPYIYYSYILIRKLIGPFVRLLWIKKVDGIKNIPKTGPVIIAFNHQSYLDFICFIAVCPRQVHFLSAEKFFSHKIWKHFMRFTGQIKVQRSDHDKKSLHTRVYNHFTNGKVLGIFPEGTRSADPVEMLHAFTGVAKYAITSHVPIIPVGIKGAHEVLSRHDTWPRFKKSISFRIGTPIHLTEHYGKNLNEHDYRNATDRIMLEIASLSGKHYSHVGKLERNTSLNSK